MIMGITNGTPGTSMYILIQELTYGVKLFARNISIQIGMHVNTTDVLSYLTGAVFHSSIGGCLCRDLEKATHVLNV